MVFSTLANGLNIVDNEALTLQGKEVKLFLTVMPILFASSALASPQMLEPSKEKKGCSVTEHIGMCHVATNSGGGDSRKKCRLDETELPAERIKTLRLLGFKVSNSQENCVTVN